jgi:hypothetical protein
MSFELAEEISGAAKEKNIEQVPHSSPKCLKEEMLEDPALNWVFVVSGLSNKTAYQKLWSLILFVGFVFLISP